jgi:hypothetical protein
MPKYHGKNGALLLAAANAGTASLVANLTSWSLDIEMDLADVTAIGDDFRSFVAGVKGGSSSMSGFLADDADIPFDAFDQAQSGGKVAAYLYPFGTSVAKYWYFNAWPKKVNVDDPVSGPVAFKADLTADGTVARRG